MTTSDLPYPSTATGNQSSVAGGLSKTNPLYPRSSIGVQRESGVERRSVAGEGRWWWMTSGRGSARMLCRR